jgi:O-antigen/teichoic acid export membrane protein
LLAISGVICTIAMTAGGFLVSSSSDVRIATFILSLSMFPSALIMIAEAKAIASGRTRMLAAVTTMESVLRTVVPIALLWQGFGLIAVCTSFAVIRFIAMIAFGLIGREKLRVFKFCRREMMAIGRVAPTFAGTVVLSSINWQAPIFLLAYIGTESETAEFGAASRFLIPVSILLASYANVIQPEIASRIHNGMIDSGRFLLRAVSYPAAIAALCAIVTVVVSEQVLTLLFGAQYASAGPSLDVLAFSVIPFCAVMVISRALIATRSQRVDLIANFMGLAACLVSGSFLAPMYGATGAAIAQMVSFFVMAAIVGLFIYRKLRGVAGERRGAIPAEAV